MDKLLFKSIQSNFRHFLAEKKNPTSKKEVIIEEVIAPEPRRKIKLDDSNVFINEEVDIITPQA
jgi:hypothetical protein